MVQKYIKALKAFFSNTEKSTLAVLAIGAIAAVIAIPLSTSVPNDVVTLSEHDQPTQGQPAQDQPPQDQPPQDQPPQGQPPQDQPPQDQPPQGQPNAGQYPNYGQGNEGQYPNYGQGNEGQYPNYGQGNEGQHPNYGQGNAGQYPNYGQGNEGQYPQGQYPNYGQGNEGQYPNYGQNSPDPDKSIDAQQQEEHVQEAFKREKTRMQRDYKWILRDLERAGKKAEIAQYNDYMSKVEACTDGSCLGNVGRDLNDWAFQFRNNQFGDNRKDGRSTDIGVGPPSKNLHGAPIQNNQFGPVDPENNRGQDNFEDRQNGEFDAQQEERMQKDFEREKTRLQRDYKWTLRDLERAGMQAEIAQYNDYMSKAAACTDQTCLEDVRWALDDWSFTVQETVQDARCTQDAERMEKEMSRHTQQLDKELSRVEKDFGAEAAAEFKSIVSDMKSVQSDMISLAKACKFEEMENLRFEREFDIQDRMHAFWEEWGQKNFMAHEEDMCSEVQEDIARAEREQLTNVPEANKAEARALLQQAKAYAADCNFAELEKLSFRAKRLGLTDEGEDRAVRGYREIRREDIRGFEGHEDDLERVFSDLGAKDGNVVFERLNKADRGYIDRVLQTDDEEFKKRKLVGLKNYGDEKKANEFLQANVELKELLDQVSALKSEIASLKSEIARINFHPNIAEQVKKDAEAGTLDEELLERYKAESREAKFEDGDLPFRDFDDDTYYLDAVKIMKEKGIVSGKGEGVYDPGGDTTIAEAMKITFETAGLGPVEGETGVPAFDNHWAKDYLYQAQKRGIPFDSNINRPITRGELAELIVKAKELRYENTERPVFSDVNERHPYFNAIQTLNANGVFNGSDGKGRPDDGVKRAEIATLMNSVLDNF